MVQELKTLAEFDGLLQSNKKVAVDFTASWCPPCRMIGPIFAELQSSFPNITFVKVDVDTNSETAEKYQISAMPTFKFIVDGKVVDELVGASSAELKAKLEKLDQM